MNEIRIEKDNTKILIWGWAVVIGLGALAIVAVILAAAIAQALIILAGCAGFGMIVLSVGKAATWWKLADAETRRADALFIEAKARFIEARRGRLEDKRWE